MGYFVSLVWIWHGAYLKYINKILNKFVFITHKSSPNFNETLFLASRVQIVYVIGIKVFKVWSHALKILHIKSKLTFNAQVDVK